MRVVWLKEFGGPEVLVAGDAPEPPLGPGQTLIDVSFASITFVETQVRAGRPPNPAMKPSLPAILGNGVGGIVTAVGADADQDLVGRQVISTTGGSGGYAERVAVDAAVPIVVPDGVALDDALALLADGRTATWLLHVAQVRREERVLVEAAAGGVGTLLVQLAAAAGATVVAAAGGARKVELARALGAAATVDYREADWTERVRREIGGVDLVLDGVGGAIARGAFGLLGPGGRMLSYGMASGEWAGIAAHDAAERGVTLIQPPPPTPAEMRAFTEQALVEAAAGRLRPVIGQRFPLERAADAHAAIEARETVGKTLLEVR